MEFLTDVLTHPFTLGLVLGLVVALWAWLHGLMKQRACARDNQTLREHLHTQMQINAAGNANTREELEALRKQNENLRITVATLKAKPGRAEVRTLHLYDRAVHLMYAKAPGFASAWESMLKEAEAELEKSESGLVPLIRKVFRPSLIPASLPEPGRGKGDVASAYRGGSDAEERDDS